MAQIQINPQLDPAKVGGNWVPPGQRGPARAPRGPRGPQAPQGPQSGFFLRGAALIIDLAALWCLAWTINWALRPQLLQAGSWPMVFAGVILVLYFALADGPVGRGRTLGKLTMSLRTLRRDGGILTFSQALGRSFIKTAPLLGFMILQNRSTLLLVGGRDRLDMVVLQQSLFALLIANLLCLVFDPFYRSFQDFACRSVIIKSAAPIDSVHTMLQNIGLQNKRPLFARIIMIASPFIALIAIGVIQYRKAWNGEARTEMRQRFESLHQILGTDEFFIERFTPAKVPLNPPGPEAAAAPRDARKPDTGPQALEMGIKMGKIGAISPETRVKMGELAQRMPELRQWILDMTPSTFADQVRPLGLKSAYTDLRFYEILDLGYDFHGEPVYEFRGDFPPEEMAILGVESQPTTGTLETANDARITTETISEMDK